MDEQRNVGRHRIPAMLRGIPTPPRRGRRGGLGVGSLLALEDCSFRVLFLPDFGLNCMFRAVLELEPTFLGRMALGGVHGYKLFVSIGYVWLRRTERAFRQSELQYFAGNFWFRRFWLLGDSCGARAGPLWESSMIQIFSPLFDRIAGRQMPASSIPRAAFATLFLRGPLAPVDRTSTAALKRSAKTAASVVSNK